MNTYDALIILSSRLKEEVCQKTLEQIGAEIAKLDGQTLETRPLGRRPFSRTMKKEDSGYYFEITFKLKPDNVASLRARCKLNENIFRIQIVTAIERPVARPAAKPAEAGV